MRYLVLLLALAGCSSPAQAPDACLEALDAAEEIFTSQAEVSRADIDMLDALYPAVAYNSTADIDRLTRTLEGKLDAAQKAVDVMNRVDFEGKAAECRSN